MKILFSHMKTIIRLAKKSAKNIQKKLLENGKPFCKSIDSRISVSKLFLNHITYSENRPEKEVIQRLLIAGFTEGILQKGALLEIRHKELETTYRITDEFGIDLFSIIITKTAKDIFLLSCFLENKYTKKDLS